MAPAALPELPERLVFPVPGLRWPDPHARPEWAGHSVHPRVRRKAESQVASGWLRRVGLRNDRATGFQPRKLKKISKALSTPCPSKFEAIARLG